MTKLCFSFTVIYFGQLSMASRGGRGEALKRLLEAQEAEKRERESAIPLQQVNLLNNS
jgi:hypothetical protein